MLVGYITTSLVAQSA